MPLFTFCTTEYGQPVHRLDIDLRDRSDAQREALRTAGSFLSDSASFDWSGERWHLSVFERGQEVLNLDVVAVGLTQAP